MGALLILGTAIPLIIYYEFQIKKLRKEIRIIKSTRKQLNAYNRNKR